MLPTCNGESSNGLASYHISIDETIQPSNKIKKTLKKAIYWSSITKARERLS